VEFPVLIYAPSCFRTPSVPVQFQAKTPVRKTLPIIATAPGCRPKFDERYTPA
jgi:hypothetical protein